MCTKNELSIILDHMYKAYYAVYGKDVVNILLYESYARGDYADFFIVSQSDAKEQLSRAEEFYDTVERYVQDNYGSALQAFPSERT